MSAHAQVTLKTFEGIDSSTDPLKVFTVDPNGAIGTKQYLEWVDQAYQGFDKTTGAPVTPVVLATMPFKQNGMPDCASGGGNGVILFDHLASRWIMAIRMGGGTYFYCIAVSNTDDLTAGNFAWFTYELPLNPYLSVNGKTYYPDYPKIAVWPDAYYVTIDLQDTSNGFQEVGILVCAFDRANLIDGLTQRTPQCFRYPKSPGGLFLGHSLLPADLDGTVPPPVGTPEDFVSIQNPSAGSTSTQLNFWQMHVDWTTPTNTTFTGPTPITVATYIPGCYNLNSPGNTFCVPQPTTGSSKVRIDSVGDRLMHRFAFRQFPTYQSYLVTHDIQNRAGSLQTAIRWYELRPSGSSLAVHNSGTISPDTSIFRFVPSIAQDKAGNMAVGYSGSATGLHPSIGASYLNLISGSKPTEFGILMGSADTENTDHWGGYESMTVDPVDDCTFWYVNEYFTSNQTGTNHTWRTRLARFRFSNCN